jgi:EpsI family protein
MSGRRLAAVGAILVVCAAASSWRSAAATLTPESSLAGLPYVIGSWEGRPDPPLEPDVEQVLGADEYVLRTYAATGDTGAPPVGLYVAFYASQQTGATIHSPLNCLPGAGWDPIERGRVDVPLRSGETVRVNRYVVQKGMDRQAVYYWFQSRGRVVASEYTSRLLLVRDALASGRGDGALVRLTVPMRDGDERADRAAREFLAAVYPALRRHLPN